MFEISRGTADQFEEIIDFIDFVFSKSSVPHDFPAWYPNLYEKTDESMRNLINLWENGKIKGSILAFPRRLALLENELTVVGIGSVAAHPRERGRGIMTRLMEYNDEEMKANGVHMSNLGGMRSRYNHFGYENSGNVYVVNVSRGVAQRAHEPTGYTFRRFSLAESPVAEMKAIYDAKPFRYVYDESQFALRLTNLRAWAYTVHAPDGSLFGYIAVNEGRLVREIVVKDDAELSNVVFDFLLSEQDRVELPFGQWQLPYMRRLVDVGGGMALRENGMWNILRWEEVLRAFLAYKASFAELEEGTLVVEIEGEGRFALSVSGGKADVAKTSLPADVTLTKLEATRFFFSIMPKLYMPGAKGSVLRLVESWLPLPLTWFNTECV